MFRISSKLIFSDLIQSPQPAFFLKIGCPVAPLRVLGGKASLVVIHLGVKDLIFGHKESLYTNQFDLINEVCMYNQFCWSLVIWWNAFCKLWSSHVGGSCSHISDWGCLIPASNQRIKINFRLFENLNHMSSDPNLYCLPFYWLITVILGFLGFLYCLLRIPITANSLYILSDPSFDHYLDISKTPVSAPLGLGCHWPRYSLGVGKHQEECYHTSIIPFHMEWNTGTPPKKIEVLGRSCWISRLWFSSSKFTTSNQAIHHQHPKRGGDEWLSLTVVSIKIESAKKKLSKKILVYSTVFYTYF